MMLCASKATDDDTDDVHHVDQPHFSQPTLYRAALGELGCWHAWRLCLVLSQQCSLCAILCHACSPTAGTEECLVQPGYHELGNTACIQLYRPSLNDQTYNVIMLAFVQSCTRALYSMLLHSSVLLCRWGH